MADPQTDAAPSGRDMTQPYEGPHVGPGIAAAGRTDAGGLRAAMGFAEMIVDTVREGLLVLDLDLRVQAANESFYRMFGGTREQTEGKRVYELDGGVWDRPELRVLLERVLPEKHVFDDFEVERGEGDAQRVYHLNGRQLAHHQMVLVAATDVTDRVLAQQLLAEREASYRALFSSIDEGFALCEMITDDAGVPVDYRFLDANPAFAAMTGIGADPVGRTVRELVPGFEHRWVERYVPVALGGESIRFEETSDVMGRAFDVFAAPAEPAGRFTIVFTDVTAQRQAEASLRASEALFDATLSTISDFAYAFDRDGRFVFVNRPLLDLWGLTLEDAVGKTFHELPYPDALADRLHGQVLDVFETGRGVTDETTFTSPTGKEGHYEYIFQPVVADGAVPMVVGSTRDVTERKRAEAEIRDLNATLERRVAERTAEVRDLAARLTIAEQDERERIALVLHDDLQQQLYGLTMSLALLKRDPEPAERVELLDRVSRVLDESIQTARTLATELSPTILQSGRLADLLEWMASAKRREHGLGIEIEVRDDPHIGERAVRVLVYQSLHEVLFNIVKHSGGSQARLVAWTEGDCAVIRVEDDGAGFDVATVVDGGKGGFGLFSVRERLSLVGGRFEVDSAPGRGTRVILMVPSGKVPE